MTGNPDTSLTIDTHHHILPDFFWQETENAHAPVGGLAPLQWSKEASISFMDDAGIDVAVVSLSTPGVHTGDSAKARALARRCNEFSAELVRSQPDRFGGFACLPLPDVDASLEELSYAIDVLGLDGFVLFTNSNGVYLGDPVLEPVFEELERRKTVVYVHPNPSPDAVAHALGLPDNLLDFPTDTNRAVAQMHYTNRFALTPNVKYIFSHAGGSIPTLPHASRSSMRWDLSRAASSEAPLLTCSAGFIGTRRLLQVIQCSACCATWQESIKFCMERIFRIYAGTWP
jgi:predicted TIM-barrel fold metal-dependent hydrolase